MSVLKYKNPNWVEGSGQPKWITLNLSGGNEAEIMAELQKLLDEKVEEAPMDGNQYVRTNGTWSVAQMALNAKEKCTINLVSNQGEGDAASLYGATVKVTDVDSDEVYLDEVWDGIPFVLEFTGGVNYKIEVGDVADYATPEAKTLTALEFNVRNMLFTYNTEIVSVTLSADNGESMVGQTVTINGVDHVWEGTAVSQKVAYGVTYSVTANDKQGYSVSPSQTFLASQIIRNANVMYFQKLGTLNPSFGIYIQDVDGYFLTEEEWDKSIGLTPNGIAVIDSNCSFVIALEHAKTDYWDGRSNWSLISGVLATTDESVAKKDYEGYYNTEKITSVIPSYQKCAAWSCKNFVFPNGKSGYLGSAGEWQIALNNRQAITKLLNKFGSVSIGLYDYWTSTQYDKDNSWINNGGVLGHYHKQGSNQCLSFLKINN